MIDDCFMVFYVSGMRNVCFPAGKRTFSTAETYVSRKENIENAGSLGKKCACGVKSPGHCLFSVFNLFFFGVEPQVPSRLLYVYLSLFPSACAYTCARTCPREIHIM